MKVLTQIQEIVTLKLLPIPRKWWTLQNHVENSRWSQILIKFRSMNAGLGISEQWTQFVRTEVGSFNAPFASWDQMTNFIS